MIKDEEGNKENRIIFSYINDDNYQPLDHFGPREVNVTSLRKNVDANAPIDGEKSSKMFIDPNQQLFPTRYTIGDDFIKMFIMADLEPTTLLMSIHYRQSDGLFMIYPDFNDINNEYHIEIDQNSKQSFVYVVENLSKTFNDSTSRLVEKEKLDKIQEETCELMKKLNVSKEHDFTYPKFCRIVFMMEIIDARGFEFDNIHVHFHIKLPKFVKLVDGNLKGSTHSSLANGNLWNFGFCHSLVIDIDDEFLISKSQLDFIMIDFEVISIDTVWERERREGIASLKLPLEGKSSGKIFEISCYRDLQGGSWLSDFFERFFLGGIYKTQETEHKNGNSVNFYGNQTVSTGSLRVKIQKIQQTKPSKRNNLKMKSVDEIISKYHKAKAKLEI
jgi:Ciliary basal body-associated, B9 protein